MNGSDEKFAAGFELEFNVMQCYLKSQALQDETPSLQTSILLLYRNLLFLRFTYTERTFRVLNIEKINRYDLF